MRKKWLPDLKKFMLKKIFRSGNSLAVVIPYKFIQAVGIKAGDEVKIKTDERNSKITYIFPVSRQLPLDFLK
jgi:antitoxin component of MazEF toxin-antitoxin module